MKPPSYQNWLALLGLLVLATAIQGAFAAYAFGLGGQPDLVFTLVVVAAVASNAGTGSVLGLAGGFMTAALVGGTVGTTLVACTAAGFAAGAFAGLTIRSTWVVVLLGVLLASVVSAIVTVLAAPGIDIGRWLSAALVGTAYNALLAVPVAFLLRRIGWGAAGADSA